MIRGQVRNITMTPVANKNVSEEEAIFPLYQDLRNGRINDAGNWEARPGYAEYKDYGVSEAINLLIPDKGGYVGTDAGKVFTFAGVQLANPWDASPYRPYYAQMKNLIILTNGETPVKITGGVLAQLGGSPPRARFCNRVSEYLVMSGYQDAEGEYTEFKWCVSGNPELWTGGDSGFASVKKDGGIIRNTKVKGERLYHFKDHNTEVWSLIGSGAVVFVRNEGAWINKGTLAGDSVVDANDTFYWFGDDGDFYVLDGGQPKVISSLYRRKLDEAQMMDMWGADFRKERLIRWFAPTAGRCFTYDYVNGVFSEDNIWRHGQWERLPVNSYMELGGRQYFGSSEPIGKVYEWGRDYTTDAGQPIRVFRKMLVRLPVTTRFTKLRVRRKTNFRIGSPFNRGMVRTRIDEGEWLTNQQADATWMDFLSLGIGKELGMEIIEFDGGSVIDAYLWMRGLDNAPREARDAKT